MRICFFNAATKYFFIAALFFLILLQSSCKKDVIQLDYLELNTGNNTKLRGIFFHNENRGFVCGGEKNQYGVILKTADGGNTWQTVYSTSLALRDITFVNDTLGFACGDSLLILKTTDGGETWNTLPLPYTPVVIAPFSSIQFRDEEHGFVCGGINWERGLALRTNDGGAWWDYQAFYNTEITENIFLNDTTGFLSAYGAVFKATSDVLVNNLLNLDGDFFTSVSFISVAEGLTCGYDGGIYKTSDGGATWKTVRKKNTAANARIHFNKIRVSAAGKALAAGNEGAVFFSADGGESWKQSDNFPEENIYSVFILNLNTAFLAAEKGKVYKVSL